MMACADLARIINSDQVQAKLNDIKHNPVMKRTARKNPLKNKSLMQRLNPNSKAARALAVKAADQAKNSKAGRKDKAVRSKRFQALHAGLEQSVIEADNIIQKEIQDGVFDPDFQY